MEFHVTPNTAPDVQAPLRKLQRVLGRVLGALLAFPAVKLLWPWPREASLEGDLYPELTGAAIGALATLPAFAVLYGLRRAPRPGWLLLFAGFAASALLGASRSAPSDTLELDRWGLLTASCFALALGGAALDREGRLWLARAASVVTLVAVGPALADGEHQYSGVLGNTGLISESGLIGAAVGVGLLLWDAGPWRWIGGACALLYGVYVGLAPVFAGAAALAAALLVATAATRDSRKLIALAALFVALGFGAGRILPRPTSAPRESGAPVAGLENTGGFEVRRLIWARVPAMLLDAGLFGVGPGQFAAAFPPYRDPREIELSSLGRRLPGQETEVQHAHSDYLQAFCDAGPIGGLLFVALAAFAAWRALRALREGVDERATLALGLLAVLANGVLREPLTNNPVSAMLAFALLGAVCSPADALISARAPMSAFAAVAVASLAIALQIPSALSIGLHGRALRNYFEQGRPPERLAFVLDARPDSVVARGLAARGIQAREGDAPTGAAEEAWREVLALRPHSLEAWMQLGLANVRAGQVEPARAAWLRALTLDPGHPGLLRNLALLEARHGDAELSKSYLARIGVPFERAFRDYATGALLELDVARGWELLAQVDERWRGLDAERAHNFARAASEGLSEAEANALEGSAHVTWGREHAESGAAEAALRSYRQARRCLAQTDASGAASWSRMFRLEFAGALALAGELDAARAELGSLRATPAELARLPHWAGQALLDARLLLR